MNTKVQNPTVPRTLADLLKTRGTLTQKQILSLLQPVISSLSKMHSQGLVHGHISPETILLRDSRFLLFSSPLPENYRKYLSQSLSCDEKERLGCTAFLADADAAETSDDRFDVYRAPEAYISNRFVTPAADVYSLCAAIYTTVTGYVPESVENVLFNREAKPIWDVLTSPLQNSDNKKKKISSELMDILKKGVSLFPKGRYADVYQLKTVLEKPAVKQLKTVLEKPAVKQLPQLDRGFIEKLSDKVKSIYPNFQRDTIESITFLDTLENVPSDHVILSEDQYGVILAWVKLSASEKYDVFISADGGISAAPNMSHMFSACKSLTNIDLSSFDTSNVTDMCSMFFSCKSLTNIDLSSFDTSNVTDMSEMFFFCEALTNIDLSSFDTSNVTNMSCMFSYCEALTNINLGSFDTSNVTDMSGMFFSCKALTNIDLSSFDTSNVTDMSDMFSCCEALTNINLGSFDTSNVTDMSDIFKGCDNLSPDIKKKITGNAPD